MDRVHIKVPYIGETDVITQYILEGLPLAEQRLQLTEIIEGAITAATEQNISGLRNSLQLALTKAEAASLAQNIGLPERRRGDDYESIPMKHQETTVITTEHPHIVRNMRIGGGEPIIAGTSVRVRILVEYWREGTSPEELIEAFPHLTLAQVFDALSYYQDHQPEINLLIEQNRVNPALFHESTRQPS